MVYVIVRNNRIGFQLPSVAELTRYVTLLPDDNVSDRWFQEDHFAYGMEAIGISYNTFTSADFPETFATTQIGNNKFVTIDKSGAVRFEVFAIDEKTNKRVWEFNDLNPNVQTGYLIGESDGNLAYDVFLGLLAAGASEEVINQAATDHALASTRPFMWFAVADIVARLNAPPPTVTTYAIKAPAAAPEPPTIWETIHNIHTQIEDVTHVISGVTDNVQAYENGFSDLVTNLPHAQTNSENYDGPHPL